MAKSSLSRIFRSLTGRAPACVDVAGAEGQDEIAVFDFKPVPHEMRLTLGSNLARGCPCARRGIHDHLAGDPGNRLFAGGINIGNEDRVGIVKSSAEIFPERERARE